ncbi:MAG TPA: secondary thiamine-phosphate synthase enzyme YjbQ [Acidobacteriota bacterium]|nr:secondary thiamine-phosphate synthase enzyme YjbQ [Acidobacteriota bacterium]
MVGTKTIEFRTDGDGAIVDLTDLVLQAVATSGILDGIVCVCATGSTAAVTTIEYEPGLIRDLPDLMQRLIPAGVPYQHDATWGDGNGYAHLRSALIGTSFTTAVVDGKPDLGTWQQIVFLEFDNRARRRRVRVQIIGE